MRLCVTLGRGCTAARTDRTQQPGQTPDKEINHITIHVNVYTETDPTGMLSANNCRLFGPTNWVCFDPTFWPDTGCSLHRICVLLQWTKRI